MATPFTTWAALYKALLDVYNDFLSSGQITTRSLSFNSGSTSRDIQLNTAEDIRKELAYVKGQADTEAADTSGVPIGRSYAKQGGGGRW